MKVVAFAAYVLGALLGISVFARDLSSPAAGSSSWSKPAAAAYLDGRMNWWIGWDVASRDHGTFCISCHTVVPYAMARPALREAMGEQALCAPEARILASVRKRVEMWKLVDPFFPDASRGPGKTVESRGTEAVLNALILVGYDAPTGKLSPDARLALDNMWSEQLKSGDSRGAWPWLQFHNAPWEGDSQYYGAAMAALAVGSAPEGYQSSPAIAKNVRLLREYLVRLRFSQLLINRLNLLWASTKMARLLTPTEQAAIIDEALSQQHVDGGFSLSSFVEGWKRHDGTPLETRSDGYATGAMTYILQQSGIREDEPHLLRGLAWLAANQDKAEGRWVAYSLNKQEDISTYTGHFMSDAATAFAVMALQSAH